jgi:FixJ family two-component response regulator
MTDSVERVPVAVGPNVVIVDDDDSMREAITRLLRAAGFEPFPYSSAEAFLASGAAASASCVVCDLRLPAMSGFDLLAALRARGEAPPLILITAHDAPGLREEAQHRGASAYLPKPFRGTALLESVRALISNPRPH